MPCQSVSTPRTTPGIETQREARMHGSTGNWYFVMQESIALKLSERKDWRHSLICYFCYLVRIYPARMLHAPQSCTCLSEEQQKPWTSLESRCSLFVGTVHRWASGPEGCCSHSGYFGAGVTFCQGWRSDPEGQNGQEIIHLLLCILWHRVHSPWK